MPPLDLPVVRASEAVELRNVPEISVVEFRDVVVTSVAAGGRLVALFGEQLETAGVRLHGVVADAGNGHLALLSTVVEKAYPALTPDCAAAQAFEREIAEEWDVTPQGHPWLKGLRRHAPHGEAKGEGRGASEGGFFQVRGEEVHEVAVGPVHAGVIEPGHFRFQCHGERVLHLEISLGYQHRGVERALVGGPDKRTVHYMETAAGDTTVGHATAYCQAIEALGGCEVSTRAEDLRAVALELERLANHTGDLGALAGDVGYLPAASFCGRLRGEFLNMTAMVCGSRLGRGWIRPGGVAFDLDEAQASAMRQRLTPTLRDLDGAVALLWNTSSVRARFEETGALSRQWCEELGLVGPVARACGVRTDIRLEFPSGAFQRFPIPIATWSTGDVFARARVRWIEIQHSNAYVQERLAALPAGSSRSHIADLRPRSIVVSLVEGWRGRIAHVAITDQRGRFCRYKIIDPSFHNWPGLALAMRDGQISDFPLCNKSFNLSYCGHDL